MLLKTFLPVIKEKIQPFEQKIIEWVNAQSLMENESEICLMLKVVNNRVHAILVAVDFDGNPVRQIPIQFDSSTKYTSVIISDIISKLIEKI